MSFKSRYSHLSLDGINTSTIQANVLFNNKSVVARQEADALLNYSGNRNVFLGYESGKLLKNADDNIFMGYQAGWSTNNAGVSSRNSSLSSTNLFIGSRAGFCNLNGYSNMFIGHNNSKDLTNEFGAGVNNERIFDNISIGADGSAYGAKTITLGNRSITHEGNNATVIGFGNSNTGHDTLLIGSDIYNNGNHTFILHSRGDIVNEEDYYVNINDIFTGFTRVDDGDSYLEFNLDKFIIDSTIESSNVTVKGDFVSEHSANLNHVSVNGDFDARGDSTFHNEVLFMERVRFEDSLSVRSNVLIEGNLSVATESEFTGDVNFSGLVTFPTNHTFTNDIKFSSDVLFTRNVNIEHDLNVKGKRFQDYLSDIILGEINIIDYLPSWVKKTQGLVDVNAFNKDNLSIWIIEELLKEKIPWLNSNQIAIGLEDFNKDEFAPWIDKDPKNIDLVSFDYTNLLKNWAVGKFQQEISLSNFANENYIKQWALKEQELVNLSEFRNDNYIKEWALKDQSSVNFSDFNNDRYQWLDELYEKMRTDDATDTFASASYYLKNEIAPWLKFNSENIGLTSFCNDITLWNNDISFNGEVEVNAHATFNGQLTTNGFTSTGRNILNGDTEINNGLLVDTIHVTESTTLNSNVIVEGYFNVNDAFEIKESSNVSVKGDLVVEDTALFLEEVSFETPFVAKGFVTEGSNILHGETIVKGDAEIESLFVQEYAKFNSNVFVDGYFSVNDSLEIARDGSVSFDSTVVFQDQTTFVQEASFKDNLTTYGVNTLYGFTLAEGGLQTDSLVVTDMTILESNVVVQGDFSVNNSFFVTESNIRVRDELVVEMESFFHSNVVFESQIRTNGLESDGSNLLRGDTEISGKLTTDNLIVTDNVVLGSNITIDGILNVNDNLMVTDRSVTIDTSVFDVNERFVVDESNIRIYHDLLVDAQAVFYDKVSFEESFFTHGFESHGSNILQGNTSVKGELIAESLRVTDNVVLGSNVTIDGLFAVNDFLVVDSDGVYIDKEVVIQGETTFHETTTFKNSFSTNGFESYGSNILGGVTKVVGEFEIESLVVTDSVRIDNNVSITGEMTTDSLVVTENVELRGSNISLHGDVNINDYVLCTESNIYVNTVLNVHEEAIFEDSTSFNKDVEFNDTVAFNSNISLTDLTTHGTSEMTGSTIINGDFRVNDDTFRIEGRNIYIMGKVFLLEELIDIDFGKSNVFVNMSAYVRDELQTLYNESNDTYAFEVLEEGTKIHNDLNVNEVLYVGDDYVEISASNVNIQGDISLVSENIHLSSNVHIFGDLFINDSIVYGKDHVEISSDIFLSSNVSVSGNFDVNNRFTVDESNTSFKHEDDIMLEINSNIIAFTDVYFKKDVSIIDANFTITNDGQDVLKIFGSNVTFSDQILQSFQSNTNLFGKVYGDDTNNQIDVLTDIVMQSNIQVYGSIQGGLDDIVMIDSSAHFKQDVFVENDLMTQSNIYIYPNDKTNSSWWKIYSKATVDEDTLEEKSNEADLVFRSRNGATMKFHDSFEESIINFTGQHRCTIHISEEDDVNDLVGKIVKSNSSYSDLHNKHEVRINEAIPVVQLTRKQQDKAVFGVVSGIEENDDTSTFSLGHISFELKKSVLSKKAMVNSVGEGGIWVCSVNGDFENGDFITSSGLNGMGMRQESDSEKNYTVAKITCDCDFDLDSKVYECIEIEINGVLYRKAFVGCIYCC